MQEEVDILQSDGQTFSGNAGYEKQVLERLKGWWQKKGKAGGPEDKGPGAES